MNEITVHFDNAREAEDITGKNSEFIADIEKAFSVEVTTRDRWLRIAGKKQACSRAKKFVETLIMARSAGTTISKQTIETALQAFLDNKENDLRTMYACRIDVSAGKSPIFPRTFGQQRYVSAIKQKDIVFGIGPAGTGKTYLAMAMAISSLLRNDVSRIILTRPAIEAGETLGFLPGDMHQKVLPYLRPLYDALYDMMSADDIERNMDRGIIEVAPLAYMRGRTLNHAFVILDEAQNTTPEQMLMFLTRLGFDSKCAITGDLSQIDLPPNKTSGLLEARHTLKNIQGISICELKDADVVRHELVQKIIKAYRIGRDKQTRKPKTKTSP